MILAPSSSVTAVLPFAGQVAFTNTALPARPSRYKAVISWAREENIRTSHDANHSHTRLNAQPANHRRWNRDRLLLLRRQRSDNAAPVDDAGVFSGSAGRSYGAYTHLARVRIAAGGGLCRGACGGHWILALRPCRTIRGGLGTLSTGGSGSHPTGSAGG